MYKIGSFNCLNLSITSSKNLYKFADIIMNEGFDIIALQEVKGQYALNRLLSILPDYWVGLADDDSNVNDYAYIWNTRRFELAHLDYYGRNRIYYPKIYKQYRIDKNIGQFDLKREPYYARFYPIGGNAPYIEIRLINTHVRFIKGADGSNSSLGAISMRKNELDILVRSIYTKISDKRYGNNRPAYTILLGDYNLNLPSSNKPPYLIESYTIDDGKNSKIITTVQKELSTISNSKVSKQSSDGLFANNYDHFTYDTNRFENLVISATTINVLDKYYKNDQEKYIKEISDHLPIAINLNLRGK